MANIFITGGTGNLGRALCKSLDENRLSYHIGSRNNKSDDSHITVIDLLKPTGLREAIAGKDLIFHLATDNFRDAEATQNLLNAIGKRGDLHFIYISIVGVDRSPFSYHRQKLASERCIKKSGIPYTILRATQFHEFIDRILSIALRYPVGLLPQKVVVQPIQLEVVAEELIRLSESEPMNQTYEIGGPQTLKLKEMAAEWMTITQKKRRIINLPLWGNYRREFYYGGLCSDIKNNRSCTWSQWLQQRYSLTQGAKKNI